MDCSPIPSPLPTETPTSLPSRLPVTSQPSTRPSPIPSGALTGTSAPDTGIGSDAPSSPPSTTSHQPSFVPTSADVEGSLAPTFPPSNQPSMASTSISSTPSLALSPSPSAPPSFNETTCPVGYTGPSCRECCSIANMGQGHCESSSSRPRYFVKNGRCRQCPSKSTSILIGIATLVVFIGLLIAYREMPTRTPALFYIGLDYLQLLSFLGTATPFKWPRVVDGTLVSLAVFNFDLDATLSPECLINMSYATKELLVLSLLVALGGGITIIFMTAKRDSFMDKFVSIALGLYYFAYLQLTSSSFEAMVGSGTKSLIIAGAIAFKVYGISFPLLVGRSLLRREARREIKSASEETPTTTKVKSNGPSSSAARRCWILYGPFQSARWYWAVVVLGRKLWLVVAGVFDQYVLCHKGASCSFLARCFGGWHNNHFHDRQKRFVYGQICKHCPRIVLFRIFAAHELVFRSNGRIGHQVIDYCGCHCLQSLRNIFSFTCRTLTSSTRGKA